MSDSLVVLLLRTSDGYAFVSKDAGPEEIRRGKIVLSFKAPGSNRGFLEDLPVRHTIEEAVEEFERLISQQKEKKNSSEGARVTETASLYAEFVGKGRKHLRKIFSDRNDEVQRDKLRSLVSEGWRLGKTNYDIAGDFGIKYKTFCGILVEFGIRSNKMDNFEDEFVSRKERRLKK